MKNLGNHQLWFDWIDQFASEFTITNNFTPEKKRHLVNGVVKDILVNYDQAQKLHRVRVNFRLPVLRSVGEILRADNAVLKRGANSPKESQTLENTGAPETVRSALLHRSCLFLWDGKCNPFLLSQFKSHPFYINREITLVPFFFGRSSIPFLIQDNTYFI